MFLNVIVKYFQSSCSNQTRILLNAVSIETWTMIYLIINILSQHFLNTKAKINLVNKKKFHFVMKEPLKHYWHCRPGEGGLRSTVKATFCTRFKPLEIKSSLLILKLWKMLFQNQYSAKSLPQFINSFLYLALVCLQVILKIKCYQKNKHKAF